MTREVVSPLRAWDTAEARFVLLDPGTELRQCRVDRNLSNPDPYTVEFEAGGRHLICPLFAFQPRTHSVEDALDKTAISRSLAATR